ncbi:tetratricopeptide repeat protein [Candidatus Pelagibacter sp.]|nr:tetratricopeptide repeat protein [Candidatus Pelagibacter sp.]
MVTKIYKIIFFCLFVFYQNISHSKSLESPAFSEKYLYNYFSALVALENNQNYKSLKFFNSSKYLKESHEPYIKKYIFSLIQSGKIKKAVNEIKTMKNEKFIDFFEAQLLLVLNSLKNNDYVKSTSYLNNLKLHKEEGTFELIVSSFLEQYIYLFNNKKIKTNSEYQFGNLSLINNALQSCYLGKSNADLFFDKIIKFNDEGDSRYLFFYTNYLLSQNNFEKVKSIFKNIDPLSSTLLTAQSKKWIDQENYNNFEKIFSCKNSSDLIAELLFIISNLYSSEGELEMSNFYFNLSNYLNPKFKFNFTLQSENYLEKEDFDKLKNVLKNFNKKNQVYYWYKIKKTAQIIDKKNSSEQAFNYIKTEFNKINNPSLKMIYEMGNIVKGFKKYDLSIKYYSKVLFQIDSSSTMYANILFRRGGSYEKIGNEKKLDEDLLKSLEINPNEPHVLNYLAYAWLERNYRIDDAIDMLEKAYAQSKNDPYIIDSIGWAYYLTGDYARAENLLRKAIKLMPLDPIVNDHYGDILWKLDRKMQANYFWNNVLSFEDTEDQMKKDIHYKIFKGPKEI